MDKSAKILLVILAAVSFSIVLSFLFFPPPAANPKAVTVVPGPENPAITPEINKKDDVAPETVRDPGAAAIYPFRALDAAGRVLEYCVGNSGNKYSTTGYDESSYASWFNWNGCARSRLYRVIPGQKIRFKITTDSCASCVCNDPSFCLYQDLEDEWQEYDCLDLAVEPDSEKNYYFTSESPWIMVTSDSCFYLHLYYSAD
jgi:hypothetical protein